MAKCDLLIELFEPDRVYEPGAMVRGRVHVRADAEITCKSLDLQTIWRTHGKGNVDSGKGPQVSLYQGKWQAGQTYQYDFEIAPAVGPSTYHGHDLNVDHYATARADVPWAFDPKTETPLRYRASAPAAGEPSSGASSSAIGLSGCLLFTLIALTTIAAIGLTAWIWIGVALLVLFGGGAWLVKRFLPARVVGPYRWTLHRGQYAPGEAVEGELVFHPPRDLRVEKITYRLTACESCESGSGTNRTTHKHVVYDQTTPIAADMLFVGGQEGRVDFSAVLPPEPIYTIDLADNKLKWSGELRIHLPGWPDWTESMPFVVAPGASGVPVTQTVDASTPPPPVPSTPTEMTDPIGMTESPPAAAPAITFEESAAMVWQVRDESSQLERILRAVRDVPLSAKVRVDGKDLFGGRDEYAYRDGQSYRAMLPDPEIPLVLYVPKERFEEFAQHRSTYWEGTATIQGYCNRRNRVLARVATDA